MVKKINKKIIMTEEQILNSMTPEELINYMNLIEECTVVIEKEYKKERELFNKLKI